MSDLALSEVEFSSGEKVMVLKSGQDVTKEIFLTDGRANPFGWSQHRLIHRETIAPGVTDDVKIGWLYCGNPEIEHTEYTARSVR